MDIEQKKEKINHGEVLLSEIMNLEEEQAKKNVNENSKSENNIQYFDSSLIILIYSSVKNIVYPYFLLSLFIIYYFFIKKRWNNWV